MLSPEKRRTAYHEAGMRSSACSPTAPIPCARSRSSRAGALGVTFSAPDSDRFNYLEPEIRAKIKVVARRARRRGVVFGEISTGAESDIQQLTEIARQMVGRWGMSDVIGPLAVMPVTVRRSALARSFRSRQTQQLIDDEIRRIVDEAHSRSSPPPENRDHLDSSPKPCSSTRRSTRIKPTRAAGVTRSATDPARARARGPGRPAPQKTLPDLSAT